MNPASIVLLGPQQRDVTVGGVVRGLAPTGRIATITAGWQDREGEDTELNDVFDHRTQNLSLYTRAERVWTEDPNLRTAHKKLQNRLRLLRRAYQVQLDNMMNAWLELNQMDGDRHVLDHERQGAVQAIRELDARHLTRIEELRVEYEEQIRPWDRPGVQRERHEIAQLVAEVGTVLIAGGHVAVLLNRLRLFNIVDMLEGKTIVAWSAGAMVMTDRVVLFHDSPPQGAGSAEMFDRGFGIVSDILTLPHAGERLHLSNPERVSRLSRRFEPTLCITLDHRQGVAMVGGEWRTGMVGASRLALPRRLCTDGRLEEFAA